MRSIKRGLLFLFCFIICGAVQGSGAPYPNSRVIVGIRFDRSALVKAAPGSDQFGYTTAADGNIYVAWGDGGGFGGTNSRGRASLGVARLQGIPPSWQGINVWGGVKPLSSQPPTQGKTSDGVIAVGGAIYLYVCQQGVWTNNSLWKSTDLGMTWTNLGQMFNEPGSAFSDPGIIQFGPDYRGARDQYIYGYDEHFFVDGLALFRVDKSKLENRADYEFFAGFDGKGNPIWSVDIGRKQRVFVDPNGTEWGVTCTYHPYLKRYLLAVRHNGDSGDWGLFDAPEPWGPWTTVGYGSGFPDWVGAKDANGASAGRPAYIHSFPQKWMSADGTTLWHFSDRGDQFNIMKAVLTLGHPPLNSAERREAFRKFKADCPTELVDEFSSTLHALKPGPRVGCYIWGVHELKGTRDWKAWAEHGDIDQFNLTGYYYEKNYGKNYLKSYEDSFRNMAAVLKQVHQPIDFAVCVGIVTSHGRIQKAEEIDAYLEIAKRAGVNGAAIFTWHTLEPYLREVKQGNYFEKFEAGLKPTAW